MQKKYTEEPSPFESGNGYVAEIAKGFRDGDA